jgi:hypothetical protein
VYSAEVNEDLEKLIQRIQFEDPETQRRKAAVEQRLAGFKGWSIKNGHLKFKNRLYIPVEENLRQRLISLYHDDPIAGHFGRG